MTFYSHSGCKYPFAPKSVSFLSHHEDKIKASSGCIFYASASYSPTMVFQPSKIIMTSKLTSLCWKLWVKTNISKSIFLLPDFFFRTLLHGLQITSWETTVVAAAIAWWINPLSHPVCLIWDSETCSHIRKGKCKVLCVFSYQFDCTANKNESAMFWDPVRLMGFWNGSCLILLSLMHQKRSHYRFGA